MGRDTRKSVETTGDDSTAVMICRVLCIFFMTYVHVNPGRANWQGDTSAYLNGLEFVLADVLGRASVPALSVLSGFLAVSAYARRPNWWLYAKDRWQTMMVPLVFWNAAIIALSLVILWVTDTQTSIIKHLSPLDRVTPLLVADRLTGYHSGSATVALNFLRDLFACGLLLPLLVPLVKRSGVLGVGLVWIAGLTIGFAPIVMRPHILMFFTIGIYLIMQSDRLLPSPRTAIKLYATLLLTLALVQLVPILHSNYGQNVPTTAFRLTMASTFFVMAVALSRSAAGRVVARLEPVTYLLYLSHTLLLLVLWGAWQLFFDTDLDWPYAVFFVAAPWVVLLIVMALYKLLARVPAAVQRVVNGKTISRRVKSGGVDGVGQTLRSRSG
jgi:succinoglycan biosynthesis protein ExoH